MTFTVFATLEETQSEAGMKAVWERILGADSRMGEEDVLKVTDGRVTRVFRKGVREVFEGE